MVQEMRRLLARPSRRRARGLWVIEGRRLVEDAGRAGLQVRRLLLAVPRPDPDALDPAVQALADRVEAAGGQVYLCSERVAALLSDTAHPQGVVALVEGDLPPLPPTEELEPPVVLLEGVQDPGNVGTILRSAAAAGAGAVLLDGACADLGHPKTLRTSAGAMFRVPAARLGEPGGLARVAGALRERGWDVLGLDPHRGRPYYTQALDGPVALVVGGEARGISPELAACCNGFLTIPMARGVESLNVAAATAVVLFEVARQRALRA
ncbi:MAG TPA: RNA methyltransferase [Limnochordales bacterium]